MKERLPYLNWLIPLIEQYDFKFKEGYYRETEVVVENERDIAQKLTLVFEKEIEHVVKFLRTMKLKIKIITLKHRPYYDKVKLVIENYEDTFDHEYVEDVNCLDDYSLYTIVDHELRSRYGKGYYEFVKEMNEDEFNRIVNEILDKIQERIEQEISRFYMENDDKIYEFKIGKIIKGRVYQEVVSYGEECTKYFIIRHLEIETNLTGVQIFFKLFDDLPLITPP